MWPYLQSGAYVHLDHCRVGKLKQIFLGRQPDDNPVCDTERGEVIKLYSIVVCHSLRQMVQCWRILHYP